MKNILFLGALLFKVITTLSQGTGGYVLQNSDGTIRVSDNSISIGRIIGLQVALDAKQATLVSGTNIKTINGASVLGSGDLVVSAAVTATSGIGSSPTSSSTQTITHNLGRTPVIIDISAVGRFTSNAAATPTPFSNGGWTSSGNSCIYMTTAGTTTQDGLSSSTFAVFIATSSGNTMSGVIQNVTSNSFDIQWSEVGTAAALPFRWKCQ